MELGTRNEPAKLAIFLVCCMYLAVVQGGSTDTAVRAVPNFQPSRLAAHPTTACFHSIQVAFLCACAPATAAVRLGIGQHLLLYGVL